MPKSKPEYTPDEIQPEEPVWATTAETSRQITSISIQIEREFVGNTDDDRKALVELVEEYADAIPGATIKIADLTTYITGHYSFRQEPDFDG